MGVGWNGAWGWGGGGEWRAEKIIKSTSTVTLSSHSGWVAQCVDRSVILCERFPRSPLSRVKAGFSVFLSLYMFF